MMPLSYCGTLRESEPWYWGQWLLDISLTKNKQHDFLADLSQTVFVWDWHRNYKSSWFHSRRAAWTKTGQSNSRKTSSHACWQERKNFTSWSSPSNMSHPIILPYSYIINFNSNVQIRCKITIKHGRFIYKLSFQNTQSDIFSLILVHRFNRGSSDIILYIAQAFLWL